MVLAFPRCLGFKSKRRLITQRLGPIVEGWDMGAGDDLAEARFATKTILFCVLWPRVDSLCMAPLFLSFVVVVDVVRPGKSFGPSWWVLPCLRHRFQNTKARYIARFKPMSMIYKLYLSAGYVSI